MKHITYLLITLFLCSISTLEIQAQKNNKKEELSINTTKLFALNDPDFAITEVPKKWENESAVILAELNRWHFNVNKTTFTDFQNSVADHSNSAYLADLHNLVIRRRVKLLDINAVNKFSEYYFYGEEKILELWIIKEDGREVKVDLEKAIKDEWEGSERGPFFKRTYWSYSSTGSQYKLFIPNLEIGDILDIREMHDIPHDFAIIPQMLYFTNNEPTVKQKFYVQLDQAYYFNYKSFNDIPILEKKDMRFIVSSRSPEYVYLNVKIYGWEDEMKEGRQDGHFGAFFIPDAKFKLANYLGPKEYSFVGEKGIPNSEISAEDIVKKVNRSFKGLKGAGFSTRIKEYINKNDLDEKGERSLLKGAYYYSRHLLIRDEMGYEINDISYILNFKSVLDYFDIKSEIFVSYPPIFGGIESVLIPDEVETFLVANVKGQKYYLPKPSQFSNFNEIPDYLEGATAYSFTLLPKIKKSESFPYKEVVLPSSTSKENTIETKQNISLKNDFSSLIVERNKKVTKHARDWEWATIVTERDYFYKDEKKYLFDRGRQKMEEEVKEKILLQKKERLDTLEDWLQKDYGKETELNNFELINDGRYHAKPTLEYKEEFTVKGLLNKAGNNYILDVGKLIGEQEEINEEDSIAYNNIYLNYPYTNQNIINVTLPESFEAKGLEDLNFKEENEIGSFTSTATMEGNILKIETTKTLNVNFVKKEDWPKMVAFLEAAYQFTQKKVVLKKK